MLFTRAIFALSLQLAIPIVTPLTKTMYLQGKDLRSVVKFISV